LIFEKSFYSDADKVLASLESSIERVLVALDNIAMLTITTARISKQTFPFVTVPEFERHVAKMAPIMSGMATNYCPLVTLDNRVEYEQFVSGKDSFLPTYVAETLQFQETYPFYYGPKPLNYSWQYRDAIYVDDYDNPPYSTVPYYNTTRSDRLDIYLPDLQRFPLVMGPSSPANWGEFFHVCHLL
jgi:hypothetical protein